MFREIRTHEKITDRFEKKEEEKGYLQIKPEHELSKEEIDAYILAMFEQVREEKA